MSWARVLHMPQANIDVRGMDRVFVKMHLFADVVHGVPNGSNMKRTRSGSKSRCAKTDTSTTFSICSCVARLNSFAAFQQVGACLCITRRAHQSHHQYANVLAFQQCSKPFDWCQLLFSNMWHWFGHVCTTNGNMIFFMVKCAQTGHRLSRRSAGSTFTVQAMS